MLNNCLERSPTIPFEHLATAVRKKKKPFQQEETSDKARLGEGGHLPPSVGVGGRWKEKRGAQINNKQRQCSNNHSAGVSGQ